MDPVQIVEDLLEREMARHADLTAAGDSSADAVGWRIEYLERMLGTLSQFPLQPERFVELLRSTRSIENPLYPGVKHPSADLLAMVNADG